MSSVSISAGSGTCWTQSGSTVKYESGRGPSIIANTSNGNSLVTSISGSIGSTSVSNNKCTYPVTITVNYSIPSGYSETSSSSGATSATIGGSTTVNYGGTTKTFSVSKTVYYKTSAQVTSIVLRPTKSSGSVKWSGTSTDTTPGGQGTIGWFSCKIYLIITNNGTRTEVGAVTLTGSVSYTDKQYNASISSYSNSAISTSSTLSGTVLSLDSVKSVINNVTYKVDLSLVFN